LTPKKILVIRLSSLGDVVLITPPLRALREHFPQADIHVATRAEYADAIYPSPWVNAVQVLASRDKWDFLEYLQGLKKGRYDLVIDLHGTVRSRLAAQTTGAKRILYYSKAALGRRALVAFKTEKAFQPKHVVDRYLECLRPLGIEPRSRQPEIVLEARERAFGRGFLGNATSWIGLVPGAKHATKRWIKDGFAEVGKRLWQEDQIGIVVLGSDEEKALVQEVVGGIGDGAKAACGLGLRQMASVLAFCKAAVTNDSGPMHLATAVGTPVVALFGPTVGAFGFFPLGERNVVLERDLACRPCSLHGTERCPEGHFKCMKEIAPEEVIRAVRIVLSK
jgi:heptosyltransferase-2